MSEKKKDYHTIRQSQWEIESNSIVQEEHRMPQGC